MEDRFRSVDKGYSWVVCASAFVGHMINAVSWATFGTFYDELLSVFPEDSKQLAWMWAIMRTIWGVSGVFVGKMTHLYGCRKIATLGAISGTVGVSVCSFSRNVTFTSIWYGVFIGFSCCAIEISSFTAVQQVFDKKKALANGLAMIGSYAGIFIFPPLFTLLIKEYSWRGSFLIQSAIYLNIIPASLLYYPHYKQEPVTNENSTVASNGANNNKQTEKKHPTLCTRFIREMFTVDETILRTVNFYIFGSACILVNSFHQVPLVFLVPRATASGMSPEMAALLMSCWAVTGVFGLCVSGWIADRWSRVGVCGLFVLLAGISTATTSWFHSFPWLCVYSMLYGLTSAGIFANVFPALTDILCGYKISEAFGIVRTVGGVVGLAVIPLGEMMTRISGSYHAAFIVAGCVMCVAGSLCALVYLVTRRRNKTTNRKIQKNDFQKLPAIIVDDSRVINVTNV